MFKKLIMMCTIALAAFAIRRHNLRKVFAVEGGGRNNAAGRNGRDGWGRGRCALLAGRYRAEFEKMSLCFCSIWIDMSVVFIIALLAVSRPVLAEPSPCVDWNDLSVRRQAVVETACAYYLKADCVQYDSRPLAHGKKDMCFSRRTVEGSPEDATDDNIYYTVCSSFPYETYFNAIGYRLAGSSDKCVTVRLACHPQEGITVFEYDRRKDPGLKRQKAEFSRMRSLLEPGDVIVGIKKWKDNKTGRRREGGHAVIYVGDFDGDGSAKVMHSAGHKYNFETGTDSVEKGGTVRMDDIEKYFFESGKIYRRTKVVVLRPLMLPAAMWPLSSSAKARYLHPRLRIDRRVSCGPYGSVVSGGTLEYSIRLWNFSGKPYSVDVREKLPDGTCFVSGTDDAEVKFSPVAGDGVTFGWNVPLAPGESRTVKWRVRVVASAGRRVVSGGGDVSGIASNTLVTEVVPGEMSSAEALEWAESNVRDIGSLPDCRVAGWAGGRRSKYPPRGVRVATPAASHLMEGDVVVVCPEIGKRKDFALWVKGKDGLETKAKDGVRRVLAHEVVAVLTNDFFAALRPVRMAVSQKSGTEEKKPGEPVK